MYSCSIVGKCNIDSTEVVLSDIINNVQYSEPIVDNYYSFTIHSPILPTVYTIEVNNVSKLFDYTMDTTIIENLTDTNVSSILPVLQKVNNLTYRISSIYNSYVIVKVIKSSLLGDSIDPILIDNNYHTGNVTLDFKVSGTYSIQVYSLTEDKHVLGYKTFNINVEVPIKTVGQLVVRPSDAEKVFVNIGAEVSGNIEVLDTNANIEIMDVSASIEPLNVNGNIVNDSIMSNVV